MAVNTDWISRSLGRTESGNNYAAGRVNQDGRRFQGKYQFGDARLRDLGYTMDEYLSSPEMQEQVFREHIADIDNFINRSDLAKYEGQVINGVPMNRQSMYAIAHLGGKGGLQKYLRTGGRYNPSDELGTSLSDYARSHFGPTRAAAGEMTARSSMDASSMAKDGPLGAYADSMSTATRMITEAIERNQPELESRINRPTSLLEQPPMQGPNLPGGPVGAVQGPNLPGGPVGPVQGPQLPPGMPEQMAAPAARPAMQGPPLPPTLPNQVPLPSSLTGGQAGPAYPVADFSDSPMPTPVDNFLSKLFGGDRAENRQTGSDMLAMLSQGLGQMSAGQAVNLEPVFNRMQQRQALVSKNLQDQQQRSMAERRLALDESRLNLDVAKASLEEAKFYQANSPGGGVFTPEDLEKYANDPLTAPFIPLLRSPDEDTRAEGVKGIRQIEQQRAESMIGDGAGSGSLGEAYKVWSDPTSTAEQKAAVLDPLSEEQVTRLTNLPGVKPPASVQEFDTFFDALENDPTKASMMAQWIAAKAGNQTPELAELTAAAQDGQAYRSGLARTVSQSNQMLPVLSRIIESSEGLISEDITSSRLNSWKAAATSYLRGILKNPEDVTAFEEYIGINTDEFADLDGATQQLILMAAAPMLEGTGTISDGERALIARALGNPDLSNEARIEYAKRLQAAAAMDAEAYRQYDEKRGTGFRNHYDAESHIELSLRPAVPEVSQAWAKDAGLARALKEQRDGIAPADRKYSKFYADFAGATKADIVRQVAPRLTRTQYESLRHQLPETVDKAYYDINTNKYYKTNANGQIVEVDLNADGMDTVLIPYEQE